MKLDNSTDLLNKLYITERNFFDEEGEAENCKDILEYIAKYLNCSCMYYDNSIYLINYSALDTVKEFTVYNIGNDTISITDITDGALDINSNVYETNASISINDNYNKVVVIANTNSTNSTLPNMYENLVNENIDANKYYESNVTIDDINYTVLNAFFKANENYELNRPYSILESKPVDEITPDNAGLGGSYFQRAAYYETEEEPSSLSWNTYLTSVKSLTTDLIIKTKTDNFFVGKEGYFILDLKYKLTENWNAAGCLKTSDEVYKTTKYGTGYTDTMFIAKLKIGNKYYDGETWIDYTEYENKVDGGYYHTISGPAQYEGAKWYKYKNSNGWWIYCAEEDYNNATTEKFSGDCVTNNMYYFTENGTKIFVEESYYRECELQDGFYLVHKNKEDDKIFDTEYQLTNTVSWRMNLAESEDGVAIKLPANQILYGNLEFALYNPTVLGKYPCYRTDIPCKKANSVHISDFKMKYTTSDSVMDIFNLETYESDIKYENEIDNEIVKEMDDIEMRVNTFNSNAVSYSYVLTYKNNQLDYVNNLYSTKNDEYLKAEEHCIRKYVDYYSASKYTYTNNLYNKGIKPYTVFFENTLNKYFVISAVTYNLVSDAVEITLKEI